MKKFKIMLPKVTIKCPECNHTYRKDYFFVLACFKQADPVTHCPSCGSEFILDLGEPNRDSYHSAFTSIEDSVVSKIQDLRQQGLSIKQISKKLKIGYVTVSKYC